MKRIAVVMLAIGLALTFTAQSWAAWGSRQKEAAPAVSTLTEQQVKALESVSIQKLNSQTWTIYLTNLGARASKAHMDMLSFTNLGMSSQNLAKQGFGTSNCALHIQADSSAVLETVQRNKEGDIALWRLELRGDSLGGTVSIQYQKGGIESYNFSNSIPASAPEPVAGTKK